MRWRDFHIIFFAVCVCLCGACSRPDGVLSSRQMTDVLCDLHRAEGILYVQGYTYGHDEEVAKYYAVVLEKHGVTQAQFDSSLVWYTDNPKRFDKIYPKVIARLEKEKEALSAFNVAQRATMAAPKDTLDTLPVRSIAEWEEILRCGLPLQWKRDTLVIDTAFIYPYAVEMQDSIRVARADTIDVVKADTQSTTSVAPPVTDSQETILKKDSVHVANTLLHSREKRLSSHKVLLEKKRPSVTE